VIRSRYQEVSSCACAGFPVIDSFKSRRDMQGIYADVKYRNIPVPSLPLEDHPTLPIELSGFDPIGIGYSW
jgi:hypothetical protein